MSSATIDPARMLYTYAEAGRMTGLSERTVWQLVHDGVLKARRVGRSVRISKEELERFCREGGAE
jgi:excisionase family DNA binding protein